VLCEAVLSPMAKVSDMGVEVEILQDTTDEVLKARDRSGVVHPIERATAN
jgi:hypothetical protein